MNAALLAKAIRAEWIDSLLWGLLFAAGVAVVYAGTMLVYYLCRKKFSSSRYGVEIAVAVVAILISVGVRFAVIVEECLAQENAAPQGALLLAVFSAIGGLTFEGLEAGESAWYYAATLYAGLIALSVITARASYEIFSWISLWATRRIARWKRVYVFTAVTEDTLILAESIRDYWEEKRRSCGKGHKIEGYKIIFAGDELEVFDHKNPLHRAIMSNGFLYLSYIKDKKRPRSFIKRLRLPKKAEKHLFAFSLSKDDQGLEAVNSDIVFDEMTRVLSEYFTDTLCTGRKQEMPKLTCYVLIDGLHNYEAYRLKRGNLDYEAVKNALTSSKRCRKAYNKLINQIFSVIKKYDGGGDCETLLRANGFSLKKYPDIIEKGKQYHHPIYLLALKSIAHVFRNTGVDRRRALNRFAYKENEALRILTFMLSQKYRECEESRRAEGDGIMAMDIGDYMECFKESSVANEIGIEIFAESDLAARDFSLRRKAMLGNQKYEASAPVVEVYDIKDKAPVIEYGQSVDGGSDYVLRSVRDEKDGEPVQTVQTTAVKRKEDHVYRVMILGFGKTGNTAMQTLYHDTAWIDRKAYWEQKGVCAYTSHFVADVYDVSADESGGMFRQSHPSWVVTCSDEAKGVELQDIEERRNALFHRIYGNNPGFDEREIGIPTVCFHNISCCSEAFWQYMDDTTGTQLSDGTSNTRKVLLQYQTIVVALGDDTLNIEVANRLLEDIAREGGAKDGKVLPHMIAVNIRDEKNVYRLRRYKGTSVSGYMPSVCVFGSRKEMYSYRNIIEAEDALSYHIGYQYFRAKLEQYDKRMKEQGKSLNDGKNDTEELCDLLFGSVSDSYEEANDTRSLSEVLNALAKSVQGQGIRKDKSRQWREMNPFNHLSNEKALLFGEYLYRAFIEADGHEKVRCLCYLNELEHQRWIRLHLAEGWVYSSGKEKPLLKHSDIKPLRLVGPESKHYDVINVALACGRKQKE
ncbi:MAG: hypothetical protein IJF71_01040 [Clostridia bacterium]|nr:hypothetical protein [Clostridia bacterium]